MHEMGDPSWRRACDLLAKHLQSLGQKITAIRRITNRRSSVEEIKTEREEVKRITRDANATDVQDIRKIVKSFERFILLDKSLSDEGKKLAKDAEMVLKDYERTCNDFYRKCMHGESARGTHSNRALRAFREASEDDEENEGQSLLNTESPQRVQFERDMYEELMLERQRETGEIAENVRDIHEIFQHINGMVNEQGEQLDIVENNLSSAERATRNASQHLRRAQQYQATSSRNKILFICMMIMLAIVSIGLLMN
ncbi:QA-SNARE protein [Leishmania donovani]|uniref:QA-SNARE_protein_putative n=4 Tax=Leishmania donovani species complex TaxID=38574 RepID=A0A6L0XJ71_LEIIN|nr:QA-SNARE protein putative [Leishmania infantum JPCM5]XP_003862425.1 QA-SNARE protein putative [Leishmania donovani]CAC9506566.1 QA-SNARE_protein_putative [Leishmania infantum]AYU80493.1 QA-SNARE protein putative [Leishmania donovani]CAJ1990477.1 QA-SNARE protein [Leishmania donovani]CAM69552.1 QA-SNARE protein putative [Leishmania infantum JPCM5]CBZ35732.1 QA-SNARE protein putative [Leishmania donovani]|eukprot:XP_001466513.1 QA-SNARE protein putative [Leishmania infantum JPCM5]